MRLRSSVDHMTVTGMLTQGASPFPSRLRPDRSHLIDISSVSGRATLDLPNPSDQGRHRQHRHRDPAQDETTGFRD